MLKILAQVKRVATVIYEHAHAEATSTHIYDCTPCSVYIYIWIGRLDGWV